VSLRALTLCCGVKIIQLIRVEIWEVFPKYPRNGLEYSEKALHADRYYRGACAGSQEFITCGVGKG